MRNVQTEGKGRSEKPQRVQLDEALVACHRAEELQGSLPSGSLVVVS